MWFPRISGISHSSDRLSGRNLLTCGHNNASTTQMSQQDSHGPAAQQNMIAGRVLPIHDSRRIVGQVVFHQFYSA
jgi:hypothetical protein